MSGNRLSSMSSPRQASSQHRPTPQSFDSNLFFSDLGKAANFPYATIDPEVRYLAFSSWSTVEIYAIGSPYTCPGCAIRLAMRALQTCLSRPRTPDLH